MGNGAPEEESRAVRKGSSGRFSRVLWGAAIIGFWVLVLLGALLFGASLWVRRTFGEISIDQLLTNLPGGGGEGAGGEGLVIGGVVTGLVIPAVAVLIVALLAEKSRRVLRSQGVLTTRRGRLALRGGAILLAIAIPFGGAAYAASTVGAREYAEAYLHESVTGTSLADFYVEPRADGVQAGASGSTHAAKQKNLVVIYLESVEDAFADDTVFEKNMLAPIQRATQGWDSIPSLQQYEGGGWTMSGIVSTQCGIPLRSVSSVAEAGELNLLGSEGYDVDTYLPGATCLGDVLADRGYRNVFLGGADANFAGKGAFLASHGYQEINDLKTWRSRGETEVRDDWGLSDRRLFENAKEEIARLHAGDEPFNLTMLSLDTHEPPHVYDYCDVDTEVELASITTCSMRQVAGFVDELDEQGYLDDTVVVVMGDHRKSLVEGISFWDELKDLPDRTIFNRLWSPDGVVVERDEIDQFSMYPTILELAGVELPDHRAGIGVSALARSGDVGPGSILDLNADEYRALVQSRATDFYRELWGSEAAPQPLFGAGSVPEPFRVGS